MRSYIACPLLVTGLFPGRKGAPPSNPSRPLQETVLGPGSTCFEEVRNCAGKGIEVVLYPQPPTAESLPQLLKSVRPNILYLSGFIDTDEFLQEQERDSKKSKKDQGKSSACFLSKAMCCSPHEERWESCQPAPDLPRQSPGRSSGSAWAPCNLATAQTGPSTT